MEGKHYSLYGGKNTVPSFPSVHNSYFVATRGHALAAYLLRQSAIEQPLVLLWERRRKVQKEGGDRVECHAV